MESKITNKQNKTKKTQGYREQTIGYLKGKRLGMGRMDERGQPYGDG